MNKRIKKKHWKQEATREFGKHIKDKQMLKRVVSATVREHFGQKNSFYFDFWATLLLWILFDGWVENECE